MNVFVKFETSTCLVLIFDYHVGTPGRQKLNTAIINYKWMYLLNEIQDYYTFSIVKAQHFINRQ